MILPILMMLAAQDTHAATETATVHAVAETQAVASARDAADDPAIWRDSRHPERSLIVATDKQAGLNVYNLKGKLLSSLPAGRVNNVDLRVWRGRVIVAASDRNDVTHAKLDLFELDTRTAKLTELGRFDAGSGEGYGICLYRRQGALYAFMVNKDGTIRQLAIRAARGGLQTEIVRTMKLGTQSEGCVADDRTGNLFVAEEDVGIWRFDAAPRGSTIPSKVAADDGTRLVADAEGLAIAAEGRNGGYLVVSSQGDSAYAMWRLPDLSYAGRFRIAPGATIDGTSDTDGIEIATASFGKGLTGGIMIAQDGNNAPEAQNFKIVRWADVAKVLRLR